MNLTQLKEMEHDWDESNVPMSSDFRKRKIIALQHEAEIMMHKLGEYAKRAPGKVFVTSTKKNAPGGTAAKVPPQVSAAPSSFMHLSIIDTITSPDGNNSEQLISRIYVIKTDVPLVRKIRHLIDRHNSLTNKQSVLAGQLASEKK